MSLYAAIFSIWMTEIVHMIRENPRGLRQAHIKIMDLGRFDSFHGGGATQKIVIGSPHGSYDEYTAELVQQISHQTGLPAVISSGFRRQRRAVGGSTSIGQRKNPIWLPN